MNTFSARVRAVGSSFASEPIVAMIAFILLCGPPLTLIAEVIGIYELGPPEVFEEGIRLPLHLEFTADANEELVFYAVDVSASDGVFTTDGTDYSRFEYEQDIGFLTSFEQIPGTGFGRGELRKAIEFDTVTDPLLPGRYRLGELRLDMVGIESAALPASVSIEAFGSTVGVQESADPTTFDFVAVNFSPGSVLVPEPTSSFLAWFGALAALRWYRCQRRLRILTRHFPFHPHT